MKQKKEKINLPLVVVFVVLMAVAVLMAMGVFRNQEFPADGTAVLKNGDTVGKGETEFPFVIVDRDGHQTAITVKTDEEYVGRALQLYGIVEGEMGDYGLYVKKVNGITAVYEVDQSYWAFYVDGAYANQGMDQTPIEQGHTYEMRVEK